MKIKVTLSETVNANTTSIDVIEEGYADFTDGQAIEVAEVIRDAYQVQTSNNTWDIVAIQIETSTIRSVSL